MVAKRADAGWVATKQLPNLLLCRLFHGLRCNLNCGKDSRMSALNDDPSQSPGVPAPNWYLCRECKSFTEPKKWKHHYCIPYQEPGKRVPTMDISKKRWDAKLQCWVLDPDVSAKFYDHSTKSWVEEKDYYAASCEIGQYKGKSTSPTANYKAPSYGQVQTSYSNYGSNYTYDYCYPWEGVDRKKFPNTWWELFNQYHLPQWHSSGKYIPAVDWRRRLKGEYPPEPKHGYHYSRYHDECEG